MGQDTKIQWAHHTFNPWRGCTKVAEGCKNCYADAQSKRNPGVLGIWGPKGTRVVASETAWLEPRKWNKAAVDAGERHRVFCASLADVFEDWDGPMIDHHGEQITICDNCLDRQQCQDPDIGCQQRPYTMADARERLFRLIDATPNLDWLLVTKRPENIRKMWLPSCSTCYGDGFYQPSGQEEMYNCPECYGSPGFRKNVWLLTSIACQEDADRNNPELLKCRDLVPVLGVSAEPLIGPIAFDRVGFRCYCGDSALEYGEHCDTCLVGGIDWVIVGGESGPNARPCNIEWIRSIVRQCADASVPCFVKQLGAIPETTRQSVDAVEWPIGTRFNTHNRTIGREWTALLKDKKGGDPDEWPADLRVREFPEVGR